MTDLLADGSAVAALFIEDGSYLHPALPVVWYGVVLFTLGAYVALDGFDFGIGMLYATRRDESERETLLAAFGPVWDANEVWLVAFGTTLLAAFPSVYAALLSQHYLLTIGVVLSLLFRGVAPELREHGPDERWRRTCDRLFVLGSTLAPLSFGTLLGGWLFATGALALPAILTGVLLVALSLASGAAYLSTKTRAPLRTDVRRYGTAATAGYLATASLLFAVVLGRGVGGAGPAFGSRSALTVLAASVGLGLIGVALARFDRYRCWYACTFGLAVLLTVLVAVALYPTIYPATGRTVRAAAVSPVALDLLTVVGLPVLVLVLGYFAYLYTVFGGPVEASGYDS